MAKKKIEEIGEIIEPVEIIKSETNELQALKDQIEAEKKEKETFRAQMEQERESWHKERDEIAKKYTREATEKVKYQGDSIDSRIETAKALSEKLLNDADAAVEKGDFRAANRLNAEYAKAQIQIDSLSSQKTTIKQPEQIKYKSASEQWIESHPLYNEDKRYEAITISAHHEAVADGIRVESPEYFRFVEKVLDRKYYKKEEKEEEEKISSLPPSRGTTSNIRLTAEEADFALSTMRFAPDGKRRSDEECYKEYKDEKIRLSK